MPMLRKIAGGFRALLRKPQVDRELEEELRQYLENAVEQKIANGMTREQALRAARLEMGNRELIKEQVRDAGWESLVESFLQDVRYALRMLRKNPGFTALVVVTLALGIGANTAIFSLINAVMLRSLPVPEPQQLVILRWGARKWPRTRSFYGWSGCPVARDLGDNPAATGCSFSQPMVEQIRAERRVFAGVLAVVPRGQLAVSFAGQASLASAEFVSGDFFSTLRLGAAVGRTFAPTDDMGNAPPVVVLSYGYWKRQFGADSRMIGRTITVGGVPCTVVGVAAPGFYGLDAGIPRDLWLPLASQLRLEPLVRRPIDARSWWLLAVARLQPGVGVAEAEAATNVVFQRGLADNPTLELKREDAPRVQLVGISRGLVSLRKQFSGPLLLLMITVGVVLLIACANVASLMLARSAARRREIAMRFALGARRARVVRQLLTESMTLAGLGGALGIAIAYVGARSLAASLSANSYLPLALEVSPDAHVLGFTFLVACFAGVLFGLTPALCGTRMNVLPVLKETTAGWGGRYGLGKTLVIAQVALSIMVLVAAGLLTRTLANLRGLEVGFEARNVLLFDADTSSTGYKDQQLANLYPELQKRLNAIPGVVSASYSSPPLITGAYTSRDINLGGPASAAVEVGSMEVGPDFFETMHIPLRLGRSLQASDFHAPTARKVVVVNQTLARRLFGNENPVGRRITLGSDGPADTEIVGVVADSKYSDLRSQVRPTIFVPASAGDGTFEVRSSIGPKALLSVIRNVAREVNPSLAIFRARTQTEEIDQRLYQERLLAGLSSILGLLSLLLAAVGLYGLIAYLVSRRTHEIGIRMALGAPPRNIARLVVGQGVLLVAIGAVIGATAAWVLTRYLASVLYGVRPRDPLTLISVVLLLGAVALVACFVPARRAMRLDPMVALRDE